MAEHVDIVVTGAGMVGSAFAAALAGAGADIVVLDRGDAPRQPPANATSADDEGHLDTTISARVSALNPASIHLLDRIGAWDAAADVACNFDRMTVWDGEATGSIDFDAGMISSDRLGAVVQNAHVVHALSTCLDRAPNVTTRYGTSVRDLAREGEGWLVETESGSVSCELLVGADGANSRIRELAGLKSLGWSYDQVAVVTTLKLAQAHDGRAVQCFTADGPLAFLPICPDDASLVSLVWSVRPGRAERLLELAPAAFCREVGEASEGVSGEVLATAPRFSFPLSQRHSLGYVASGLALIGDAAHAIHPLAGQGVNLGFADANVLAMEVRDALLRGDSPGARPYLDAFVRRRQPLNLLMTAVMEAFSRLYATDAPVVRLIRNAGMRHVGASGFLKDQIVRLASGALP